MRLHGEQRIQVNPVFFQRATAFAAWGVSANHALTTNKRRGLPPCSREYVLHKGNLYDLRSYKRLDDQVQKRGRVKLIPLFCFGDTKGHLSTQTPVALFEGHGKTHVLKRVCSSSPPILSTVLGGNLSQKHSRSGFQKAHRRKQIFVLHCRVEQCSTDLSPEVSWGGSE